MEIKNNKQEYLSPEADIFVVKTKGLICAASPTDPFSDLTEEEW